MVAIGIDTEVSFRRLKSVYRFMILVVSKMNKFIVILNGFGFHSNFANGLANAAFT